MIANLKPYADYRIAEGGWLGEIPLHWFVRRMKYVATEIDSRSTNGKEQLLRVSQFTGVTQRLREFGQEEQDTRAASLVGYKRVEPDDLVVNIMLAWNGSMGVSHYPGIASPAYCVYQFGPDANPWYFHHLLRSAAYKVRIKAMSTGVVESRLRLYSDDLFRIEAILPPPDEQAAIVRFLAAANGQLERTIRAKLKIIALLTEQKQSIIHRAVTRGIDPNVTLKPSGIPWLGDIPQHWEVVRNLALFSHRVERGILGLPVLQVSLHSGVTSEDLDQFGREKRLIADHTKYKLTRKQDLAYNTMRMWQGAIGVCPIDGLVSPAYVVIKPRNGTEPLYYEFVFRTSVYKQQVNRHSTGIVSDRNRLYWENFKQMSNVRLPIEEQRAICRYIQDETGPLNIAILRIEREIELLREYRTRLVADVVTGKLDVREAAARLPEQTEPDSAGDMDVDFDESELTDEESAA